MTVKKNISGKGQYPVHESPLFRSLISGETGGGAKFANAFKTLGEGTVKENIKGGGEVTWGGFRKNGGRRGFAGRGNRSGLSLTARCKTQTWAKCTKRGKRGDK